MRKVLLNELVKVFTDVGFATTIDTCSFKSGVLKLSLSGCVFEEGRIYFDFSDDHQSPIYDTLCYDRITMCNKVLADKFYLKYNVQRAEYRACIARFKELAAQAYAEACAVSV